MYIKLYWKTKNKNAVITKDEELYEKMKKDERVVRSEDFKKLRLTQK